MAGLNDLRGFSVPNDSMTVIRQIPGGGRAPEPRQGRARAGSAQCPPSKSMAGQLLRARQALAAGQGTKAGMGSALSKPCRALGLHQGTGTSLEPHQRRGGCSGDPSCGCWVAEHNSACQGQWHRHCQLLGGKALQFLGHTGCGSLGGLG